MYRASVIIPVYNAEKTLARCVESLLYGRERNLEILLIDDCSRDGSWDLCCAYAEKYENVRAFRNDINRGVSYTRNRGLDEATGEYILFVDSDDWVSGEYAASLLDEAEKDKDAISVCGFHFLDHLHSIDQSYVWDGGSGDIAQVLVTEAFSVHQKTLIQQLWTKVFWRKCIIAKNLRFDETMSIGEDFQFVLDYLENAKISTFRIIDKALYYYVRVEDSLMGNFGLLEQDCEFNRLRRLGSITNHEDYAKTVIEETKRNYAYHILKSKLPRTVKRELTRALLGEHADELRRKLQLVVWKEKLFNLLGRFRGVPKKLNGKIQGLLNALTANRMRRCLKNRDFTVLSQNCIGGVLYHDMGMEFSSPTINLYFDGPDFVRFAEAPQKFLEMELEIQWGEEYPVGHLGSVTIHFMHYTSCSQAQECWNRRKERINYDKLLLLCTDRDGFTQDVFESWCRLTGPKILFTSDASYAQDDNSVFFEQYVDLGCVPDLIPKREFYKGKSLLRILNSM